MPAPRKTNKDGSSRILKIIVPPDMDADLQSLKKETGMLVAEHIRNAITFYLSFRQPGKGVNLAELYRIKGEIDKTLSVK